MNWNKNIQMLTAALFLCAGLSAPVLADGVGEDDRGAWVIGPIDDKDAQMLQRDSYFETVFVKAAADDHVFDDLTLCPRLRNVSLSVARYNLGNLKALSTKFPGLTCISIRQSQPLSIEAIAYLSCFTHLRSLELSCPVAAPAMLAQACPAAQIWLMDWSRASISVVWPLRWRKETAICALFQSQ